MKIGIILGTKEFEKAWNAFYSPDSIREIKNKKLYSWNKHDFMPKFDFEIIIEK